MIAGIALLVCAVTGLALLSMDRPSSKELAGDPVPTLGLISNSESPLHETASLSIELGTAPEIVASGSTGRIVQVFPKVGESIKHGDPLAQINGSMVLVMHTEAPLWRTLKYGDSGSDVAELQCALKDLNYLPAGETCDGAFSRSTQKAVGDFNAAMGRSKTTSFDPSTVVWMLSDEAIVGEVLLQQGEWFPATGSVLLRLTPGVLSAEVVPANPVWFEPGTYGALTFSSEPTGPLSIGEDLTLGIEAASRIVSLIPAAPAPAAVDAAPSNILKVSGFLDGSRTIDRLEVPTAALVEDSSGICAFISKPNGLQPVTLEIIGSSITGISYITGDVQVDDEVLLNPRAMGLASCSPSQP